MTACANDIENKVIGVLVHFMAPCGDPADFKPDAEFADLGFDSLDVAEAMLEMEDQFGIEIPLDGDMPVTVGDLIKEVRELMENP